MLPKNKPTPRSGSASRTSSRVPGSGGKSPLVVDAAAGARVRGRNGGGAGTEAVEGAVESPRAAAGRAGRKEAPTERTATKAQKKAAAGRGCRLCYETPCVTTACFGFPGEKRMSCATHRKDGMVNLDRRSLPGVGIAAASAAGSPDSSVKRRPGRPSGRVSAATKMSPLPAGVKRKPGRPSGSGTKPKAEGSGGGGGTGKAAAMAAAAKSLKQRRGRPSGGGSKAETSARASASARGGAAGATSIRRSTICREGMDGPTPCPKTASFALPGSRTRVRCADHRKEGMVNLVTVSKKKSKTAAAAAAAAASGGLGGSKVLSRANRGRSVLVGSGCGSGGGGGLSGASSRRRAGGGAATALRKSSVLRRTASSVTVTVNMKPAVRAATEPSAAASAADGGRGVVKSDVTSRTSSRIASRASSPAPRVVRTPDEASDGGNMAKKSKGAGVSRREGGWSGGDGDGGGGGGGGSSGGGSKSATGRVLKKTKNTHKPDCREDGCSISARFGFVNSGKRKYCGTHKKFGMINLDKKRLRIAVTAPAAVAIASVESSSSADGKTVAASSSSSGVAVHRTRGGASTKRKASDLVQDGPAGSNGGLGRARKPSSLKNMSMKAEARKRAKAAKLAGRDKVDVRGGGCGSVKVRRRGKAEKIASKALLGGSKGGARMKAGGGKAAASQPGAGAAGTKPPTASYKVCKADGCALHASFGFLQGRREYCRGHQLPGMVNLVVVGKRVKEEARRIAAAGGTATSSKISGAGPSSSSGPQQAPAKRRRRSTQELLRNVAVRSSRPPVSSPSAAGGGHAAAGAAGDVGSPSGMTRSPVVRRVESSGGFKAGVAKGKGKGGATRAAGGGQGEGGKQKRGASQQRPAPSPSAADLPPLKQSRATGKCWAQKCGLHASFGFPGGLREFCAGHRRDGMINLVYQSVKSCRGVTPGAGDGDGGAPSPKRARGAGGGGAVGGGGEGQGVAQGGVAAGGGGGCGNRRRVWQGSRCGVCDRMAKLGEW